MSVSARAFTEWLLFVGLPSGTSELSKLLQIKRTTLQNQRLRGRVPMTTVIAAARAVNVNPVTALSFFEPFEQLASNQKPVTTVELLSQVSYADALVHLLSRIRAEFAHKLGGVEMAPIPGPDAVRNWVDAIDSGDLRRQLSERTGITSSNFSAQLTDNKLSPQLAILASELSGVSSTSGLVVTGLISAAEAGWPLYGRENALSELGDVELIDLVSDRLASLRRHTKKKVDAEALTTNFLETLG